MTQIVQTDYQKRHLFELIKRHIKNNEEVEVCGQLLEDILGLDWANVFLDWCQKQDLHAVYDKDQHRFTIA